MLALFDSRTRSDTAPARRGEGSFPYWNRTTRTEFETLRTELESWFARYPDESAPDLRARFRSSNDIQHSAAFFELFLHELLRRLGCTIQVHPHVPGTRHRPEFRVASPDGTVFYLEAKVANDMSKAEGIAQARLNELYDALSSIDSPNFWINTEIECLPHSRIPVKRFKTFIRDKLNTIAHAHADTRNSPQIARDLPRWIFEHDGWAMILSPLPKGSQSGSSAGALGMQLMGSMREIDPAKSLRKSILEKAKHYGSPDLPFVIAENALGDFVNTRHVLEALFGTEVYVSRFPGDEYRPQRLSDGVFTRPSGRYTRVSSVLVFEKLRAWNFPSANVRLYHHPMPARPFSGDFTRLSQSVAKDGQIHFVEGGSVAEIFGISPNWLE